MDLGGNENEGMLNSLDHDIQSHSSSFPAVTALVSSTLPPSCPAFSSYSSLLICSCWLLMVSISLAMNKSIMTSHSAFLANCPLRTMTSRANIQKTVAIDLGTLLLQGMTISMKSKGASVLQRAMVGMLTYEASTTA